MEETTIRPATDVHLYLLRDEGVLFSQGQQSLYALNTSAAFIWIQLESGRTRCEITDLMVRQLGMDPEEALPQLDAVCQQWHDLGLLQGSSPAIPLREGDREAPEESSIPVGQESRSFVTERWYALLDAVICVRFSSREQMEKVHPVLTHLETHEREHCDLLMDVTSGSYGHEVYVNGEFCAGTDELHEIAPLVKAYVRTRVAALHPHIVNLHAGVVAKGDSCLLLPAASGSGKSTLTAGLVRAGYTYLSDETALLEMPDMRVRPYPMAICSKEGSWPALEPLYPDLLNREIHTRGDRKRVRYYFPQGCSIAQPGRRYEVTHVIFPAYRPDSQDDIKEVSPVEALARMMNDCIAIPRWLVPDSVQALTQWASRLQCYEICYGSLLEAVEQVESIRPGEN